LHVAIEAYVFVSTTGPGPAAACQAIRHLPGVVRADALLGEPPVVAIIEAEGFAALDLVIDRIRSLPAVAETDTHVVRAVDD
jgi:hypothetical protein